MMDILQRLQEGQEDDEDLMRQLAGMGGNAGAEEEEGDEDELARTLAGVDLGAFRITLPGALHRGLWSWSRRMQHDRIDD